MRSIGYFRSVYIVAGLVSLFLVCPASSQNDICVTTVGGLAGLPTLDGVVSGDPGWNNALQVNLSGDLGGTTATKALLGTDGSNLWLGLIVSAPVGSPNTTFVLTFSANDGHPENDWRLQIQPFGANLHALPNNEPVTVNYWRNSTTWNTPTTATLVSPQTTWQDNSANIQVGNIQGTSQLITHWELEFKIPLVTTSSNLGVPNPNGFCLTCNPTFKLYMNVLDTSGGFGLPLEWEASASYTQNQLVVYSGREYKCNQATCTGGPPPPGAPATWQDQGLLLFPPDWDPTLAYTQTKKVVYGSAIYQCQAGGCAMGAIPGTPGSNWNYISLAPALAQDVWPPCPTGTICPRIYDPSTPTDIAQLTPDPSVWGTGSLTSRAACTGVSLKAYASPLQFGVVPTGSNLATTPLTQNIQADLNDVTETSPAQCQMLVDNFDPTTLTPPRPFHIPSNTFVAIPNNNMNNAAQVSVTFRLLGFGIPAVDPSLGGSGLFPPIGSPVPAGCDPTQGGGQCLGVTNNPTAQAQINASSPATFQSTTWGLNYKQTCLFKNGYQYNGHPHQCLQAVMDSNDPNTRFLNRSVEQNMDFVQASTFRQYATIHGSQGNVPSPTRFLLALDTDADGPIGRTTQPPNSTTGAATTRVATTGKGSPVPKFRDQELPAIARQQLGPNVTNMYQWIARGYVYTGTTIIINGQRYRWIKRAGDFGYVAGHTGEISGWSYKFTGSALQALNPYLYTAVVDPGKTTTVETTITADPLPSSQPPGKFAVFFDLGANFPQGTFSSAFNNGFSLNAGLEFIATSHFSVEGIFGYHYASAKSGGSLNIYQFSVDGKAYLTNGNVRPFINAGIGGYAFSPGSTNFGGNVGGGVLFTITPHWGVQGSYNFHAVNTPFSATQFSTLQGGIRYVF